MPSKTEFFPVLSQSIPTLGGPKPIVTVELRAVPERDLSLTLGFFFFFISFQVESSPVVPVSHFLGHGMH